MSFIDQIKTESDYSDLEAYDTEYIDDDYTWYNYIGAVEKLREAGYIVLNPSLDPDPFELHGFSYEARLTAMGWRETTHERLAPKEVWEC